MFFLREVASHIIHQNTSNLDELTVVFPSKRAGLFFKEELKLLAREKGIPAIWLPKVQAIDEFLLSFSNKLVPEQLDLIFLLYKCYLTVYYDKKLSQIGEEDIISFDKFYAFGEMILKDFQEIDSYLAKPEQIFFDLNSLEIIREQDLETFLQYEAVRKFIANFSQLSDSDPKERFSFFWNRLNQYYIEFNKQLDEKGWSYTGKEYRAVYNQVIEDDFELEGNVCFAGFNALTLAEEKIIGELFKTGKCNIFWKYDDVFLGKKNNEGSKFLRQYISKWAKYDNSIIIKSENDKKQKNLNIINTSSQVAQVKYVADELNKIPNNEIHDTLVVLADESLLNPFLDSVPHNVEKLNVTMGFPLRNSGFWSFLIYFFKILSTIKDDKIYHRWVQMLLNSSVITARYPDEYRVILDEMSKQGEIYVNKEFLLPFDTELSKLFINLIDFKFESITQFLSFLNDNLKSIIDEKASEVDVISYHHFKKQLVRLESIFTDNKELTLQVDLEFSIKVITQLVQSSKIPYEGEPLEGLQVMGPLEIRVLDFKNIFILSMNEGVYPHNSQRTSLLPYVLRKAFDLPTFETQESIYAHHFHALMQNADNVNCLYVTKEGGVGASEKSRFLTQLIYEKEEYKNLTISEKVVSYAMGNESVPFISIPNSKEIIDKLIDRYNEEDKYLSPSALISYFECELKYYYRYVAGIRESNDLVDDLEHVDIGRIIHKALELMFLDEKLITESVLKKLLSKIDYYVDLAVKHPEVDIKNQKGYNHYIIKGARQYVRNYLENRNPELPIENVGVEELLELNYTVKGNKIKLGGNIDLITRSNSTILIDYKTGKLPQTSSFPKDYMDFKTKIKSYKNQFQVMYYSFLYDKLKGSKDFKVELRYLMTNKSIGRKSMSEGEMQMFEEFLHEIISTIFDKEKSFSQTEDEEKCLHCPFKLICDR